MSSVVAFLVLFVNVIAMPSMTAAQKTVLSELEPKVGESMVSFV